jgi:hypothetical protein
MITLASPDVSGVPAEFVKYFVMMCMAGAGMWYAHKRGMQANGTKSDPVSIAQPLDVRTVPDHAIKGDTREELKSLDEKITASARENLRQHNATAERINQVIKAGEDRMSTFLNALHAMESRMTTATLKEIKDIHERLNPVAEKVQGHHESIKHLNTRVAELWTWICKIFDQLPLLKKSK